MTDGEDFYDIKSIQLDQLRKAPDYASQLAQRPGGVDVMDGDRLCFRLTVPRERIPDCDSCEMLREALKRALDGWAIWAHSDYGNHPERPDSMTDAEICDQYTIEDLRKLVKP